MRCAIQIDVLPLPYLLFIFPRTIRDCLGQSLFHNVQLTFPAASLSSLIRFSSSDHFFQISNATLSVVLLPYIFLSNISPKFLSLKRQVLFHPIQLSRSLMQNRVRNSYTAKCCWHPISISLTSSPFISRLWSLRLGKSFRMHFTSAIKNE